MELCKYPKTENVRTFHIEAIQIPIVYNRYGDYDPNGLLVIRANRGNTVKVRFKNSLNRRLSIHVQGLSYDVNTSDGSSVGYNKDSTTGGEIWYTWHADTEGVYLFNDMADSRSAEDATNIHGLFGAIIVEAPEAKWFDPETGEELESGLMADIYQPGKPAFREYNVFFHNELEILNKPRNTSIAVHGHLWREQRLDPFFRIIPLQGGVSIGNKFDIELLNGAGCAGDYLYRSGSFAWDVESGMWGIFRVVKRTFGDKCKGISKKIRGCFR